MGLYANDGADFIGSYTAEGDETVFWNNDIYVNERL